MRTDTPSEEFEILMELALDLRWSWNHGSDEIWRALDARLWKLTRNPLTVLQSVPADIVADRFADPIFRARVDELLQIRQREAHAPGWFQLNHAASALTRTAYFSMEFMLSEALPIYSGGLGNVAGDQLKAASDLGVPVVGVGLLYQQGYFRQMIDPYGAQQALFPFNDPGQLPIRPLRKPNREWLRLEFALPGHSVWLRAWEVQVGRVRLYLLDSNDAANLPTYRGITSELYGGDAEMRLKQEMVLGIGGWRLLRALGLKPEVCHMNEGHAAFAVLERARCFMQDTGRDFQAALAVTRAGNLFTTHTAVAAGFDRFAPELIERYLAAYAAESLKIPVQELLALGRENPLDSKEPFNMAYLAFRGSGAVNAVSRLHGHVSRELFAPLFSRWPLNEVPVGHVTNGVHMPTWDSPAADAIWTQACGKGRWLGTTDELAPAIRRIADAPLWQMRNVGRKAAIDYANERLGVQMALRGASIAAIEKVRQHLNPDALTLGFARRFATYKRPNLLLRNQPRLLRLLSDEARPVQLILAGKAHPADDAGRALIQQWSDFIERREPAPPVFFLADYDMLMAEYLVQGVDVWINTPRRPWEASGTSGMKVLVNGGLNFSELDGWWAEAYSPEVGWALGDGREHGEDPAWDAAEAEALYDRLENEVIPEFYARDAHGIPRAWVARIRESMARLTPEFSANRTVREYAEKHYLPAAAAYRERTEGDGAFGARVTAWRATLNQHWPNVRFDFFSVEQRGRGHRIELGVDLQGLDPQSVRVELYAETGAASEPMRQEMTRIQSRADMPGRIIYETFVAAARPMSDYTARLTPRFAGLSVPLEQSQILWQR